MINCVNLLQFPSLFVPKHTICMHGGYDQLCACVNLINVVSLSLRTKNGGF